MLCVVSVCQQMIAVSGEKLHVLGKSKCVFELSFAEALNGLISETFSGESFLQVR